MPDARRPDEPARMTLHRRSRAGLMLGTALQAAGVLVVTLPASAQLAAGTHPTGGQVVAGQASITQGGSTTLITEASRSASIDWNSFSVGAGQAVVFRQPGSTAIALNRVTGPDPSVIAGRITANGQVVLINQSGVLFTRGSQVDTAGLVVSAAGMSDKNFAAGRLVLDRAAHPGAVVSNAGNITVRQAGLAALVAPQVANSGLISAKLGHVVLAGADTATLDLYGDKLVSLNVTGAVRAVSVAGRTIPALVANTGTILAQGGTVLLTARDADAVVSQLVTAGGTISADGAGRGGQVLVEGVGGSVEITGTLSARGTGAFARGGAVGVHATGDVLLDSGAVVDASGTRRGGTVALGTTLARARHGSGVGPHAAARVLVAAGASVRADATGSGDGGRIAVLGREEVLQAGALSARGAGTGNGGNIELSGNGTLAFPGTEDAGAQGGRPGGITIDPTNLDITSGKPEAGFAKLSPTDFGKMTGNVLVTATDTLELESAVTVNKAATSFELQAGSLLILNAGFDAGTLSGTFMAGAGGIQHTAGLITAGSLDFETTGAVSQTGGTLALSGTLTGSVGGITLTQPSNSIGTLGALTSTGTVDIVTGSTLHVAGALAAGSNAVTLSGAGIDLAAPVTAGTLDLVATGGGAISQTTAGTIGADTLTASAGTIMLSGGNDVGTVSSLSATAGIVFDDATGLIVAGPVAGGSFSVSLGVTAASGDLALDGNVTGGAVTLSAAHGAITQAGGAVLTATTLGGSASGSISLAGTANMVGTVSGLSAGGGMLLDDAESLTLAGTVSSGTGDLTLAVSGAGGDLLVDGTLSAANATLTASAGSISEGGSGAILLGTGALSAKAGDGIALSSGGNTLSKLASGDAGTGDFALDDAATLTVTGTVSGASTVALAATTLTLASGSKLAVGDGGLVSLVADRFALTGSTITATGGTVALDRATLGTFVVGTGKTLDPTSLGSIAAATLALGSANGTAAGTETEALSIGQAFDAALAAPTLALFATGTVSNAAPITATALFASAGTITLSGSNDLGTVAGLSATGTILLDDAHSLALAGAVSSSGGNVTLDVSGTGNDLVVGAPVSGAQVSLTSAGGAVSGTGGVTATVLQASAAGSLALDGTANDVGTVSSLSAAGGAVVFDDARSLAVTGSVRSQKGGVTLAVTGAGHDLDVSAGVTATAALALSAADDLQLGGTLSATSASLTATAGSITETGGALLLGTAGTLAAHAGAGATLDAAANSFGTLAASNAGSGSLVLADAAPLTVAGLAQASGLLSLSVTGGSNGLTLASSLSAGTVGLSAAGTITEGASAGITATTLSAAAPSGLSLASSSNAVGTLGALIATGGVVDFVEPGAVTLSGEVSGTSVTLTAGDITQAAAGTVAATTALDLTANTGSLAFGGLLTAPEVTLTAATDITEKLAGTQAASGGVSATSLTGSADGAALLDTAANATRDNAVGTLAGFTTTRGFSLVDAVDLSVTGSVTGTGGTLALSAPAIVLSGAGGITPTLDGAAVVLDAGAGGISAGAGMVIATSLSGSSGADALFTGANQVGTLAGFTAVTDFDLRTSDALSVTGEVDAPTVALQSTGGGLAIGALVSGTSVSLTASAGGITETLPGATAPSGTVQAGTLTGSATGVVALDTPSGNRVGTLAGFSAGPGFSLADGLALSVSGTVSSTGVMALAAPSLELGVATLQDPTGTVDLTARTGTIDGASATILASTLTGASVGAVTLTGMDTIGTLGSFADQAAFTLTDTEALLLAGTLAATNATLTVQAGSLTEAASGAISSTILGASATTTIALASANSVATLTAMTGPGGIDFVDAHGLDVTGPVQSASGSVALAVTGAGNDLAIAAGVSASTTLDLSAAHDLLVGGTLSGTVATLTASAGSVTEAGGALALGTGGTLVVQAGDGVALPSTTNVFGTLGASDAGAGSLVLADAAGLSVAGLVQASGLLSLSVAGTGNGVTLDADLHGGTVALAVAGGGVTELASVGITATTLSATVSAGLALAGTLNQVGTLAMLSAGTDIDFAQPGAVVLAGVETAGGDATLSAASVTQSFGTASAGGTLAITATSGALSWGGVFSAASAVLVADTDVTETLPGGAGPTGALTATVLSGSAGGVALLDTPTDAALPNKVGTLSGFVAAHGFTLVDAEGLTVDGGGASGADGTITLAAPTITITGTLSDAAVVLEAGPGGIDASLGAVDTSSLSGTSGAGALFTGTNTITSLGTFGVATDFDLHTQSGLSITASLGVPGLATLVAGGGGITEAPVGLIAAGTLTGSAMGTVALGSTANQVGTLAAFAAGPGFSLQDGEALVVSGTVSTNGGGLLAIGAPGLTLASLLDDPSGTVQLVLGAGGATGTAGGVDAGTLTGRSAGPVRLDGSNAVGTLAAFADTAGGFDLADSTALALAGLLSAPSVVLAASGPIDEVAGGTVATTFLAASSGGSIQLDAAGNTIGTVTGIDAAGRLLLADGGPLALDGTITAGADATLTVAGGLTQASGLLEAAGPLTATATSLTFEGTVADPGQLLTLVATAGDVAEAGGGTAIAGTLTGSATGNLLLDTAAGNQVAVLGGFTAGGNLTLDDSVAPTLTGLVGAGQDVMLTVAPGTPGTTVLAATLVAPATLSLSSPGDVEQSGGSISAGTLAAAVGGSLDLYSATNTLSLLGAVTVDGDFALRTTGGIAVAGPLTDTGGATTLTALGGDVVALPGAALTVASLTGSAAGALDLTAGAVRLGTLTDYSAAGTIRVADLDPLTLAGLVEAGGDLAVLTAPSMDVAGTLALPGAGLVSLAADSFVFAGTVQTPGGTIALSRLTPGVFSVGPGASTAATLLGLQTGTGAGEVVIGSTDGATQNPATTGIVLTAPLAFDGSGNTTGTLDLLATGDITGTGGLSVGVLTATSPAGSIALTGPNAVPVLGPFAAAGSVTFDDTTGLALTANVTGPAGVVLSAAGPVTVGDVTVAGANISLAGAAIAIGGTLASPAGTLTLSAPGGIGEAGGGTMLAATLAGPAPGGALQDGTLDLLSASNVVGTLGALAGSGDLDLRDERALTLAGPVALAGSLDVLVDGAGNGVLAAGTVQAGGTVAITAPGAVVQSGGLLAGGAGVTLVASGLQFAGALQSGGTVDLQVAGDVTETPTGLLTAGTLAGSVGGAVFLGSEGNAVGTLAALAAGTSGGSSGNVSLTDGAALTVAGPVSSANQIELSDAQTIEFAGSVTASLVTLSASGVGQTASSTINATDLAATVGGDLRLPGMNTIATLDSSSAGGALQITDLSPSVTVSGALLAGGAAELDFAGGALLLADIAGNTVTVNAGSSIAQDAGTVSGADIAMTAASITQYGPGSLVLSGSGTGTISLAAVSGDVDGEGGTDAGRGTIRVTATGNVSETGRLVAGTLSGSVRGAASITGNVAVSQLARFSSGRAMTLTDGTNLTVDGPVSAGGALQLSVGGAGTTLDLAGAVSAPTMALQAARDIDQSAGTVLAGQSARLDAAGTISLAGTFSAPTMLVGESVSPALVLWNGNTLLTGSTITKGERVSTFPPDNGSQPGIYVLAGSLVQTGTVRVNPTGAAGTLEVVLTAANGTIKLDPSTSAGLVAPSTFAFFDLDAGTASGNLILAGLEVEYEGTGSTNPTRFTGSINGVGGSEAAGFGTIGPRQDSEYLINGCPIASTNCVLLSPLVVPVENPVLEVSFDPPRRRRDDDDLVLPNVAEEDY